ncbi:MAG: DUF350 domain-containing protein [Lachnospiraceae bacterium]|nr:DUF350 domain-containing protein [Lachnospiraceae bacterium]
MTAILFELLEGVLYVAIGIVFCLIGYKILAADKHYDLNYEIDNHNKAAGIMVAGLFIAIAIIMSGTL